ncbi:MAG: hypothetical protein AB8D78_14830 [Akkermansiaceae bacterium]
MKRPKTYLITAITFLVIVFLGVWGWNSWAAWEERRLDAAYQQLFPELPLGITNRHYAKTEAFTDWTARYRFDGGSEELVKRLIEHYDLVPAEAPFESSDPAPSWWTIPARTEIYSRGSSHDYSMLVFDPKSRRVLFEQTRN